MLYAALDAQRQIRHLTWGEVAREINARFERTPARPISTSTLTGMLKRRALDGDGVLQMLLWLRRTPESFMPESLGADVPGGALPEVGSDRILRFDTRAIYSALEAQRSATGKSWTEIASEIGVASSSLTRLSRGGRTGFPDVMRIVRWLGLPAARFTRISEF